MTGPRPETVIAAYVQAAEKLVAPYDAAVTTAALLADLLPPPGRMLDLGAGTGRDAAWFADRLPDLATLTAHDGPFGLVLANGVLHHLAAPDRQATLARISPLCAPGARLILSLRHGPTPADRPGFAVDVEALLATAQALGLACQRRIDTGSHQPGNRAAGVTWTWLVLTPE